MRHCLCQRHKQNSRGNEDGSQEATSLLVMSTLVPCMAKPETKPKQGILVNGVFKTESPKIQIQQQRLIRTIKW